MKIMKDYADHADYAARGAADDEEVRSTPGHVVVSAELDMIGCYGSPASPTSPLRVTWTLDPAPSLAPKTKR